MRLGILAQGMIHWGGGLDFLHLIVDSLVQTADGDELHLLVPGFGYVAALRNTLRARRSGGRAAAAGTAMVAQRFSQQFPSVEVHRIDSGPMALRGAARRLALECLLPALSPPRLIGATPWIGYLYDFQHRHYPQFFSEKERRSRDRAFATMTARARSIIVNARAVARDVERFCPGTTARVVALPFSPSPRPEWFEEVPGVREKYAINRPYFLIANQFWVHKNHRCAFEAFAMLDSCVDAHLVCTGDTGDHRHPGYFEELKRGLREARIIDRVHILGYIPKRDQIELIKHAIAVVQPTLFEGGPGGGATYDAVSLGVPVILSDIPVNREVDLGEVTFFAPDQPAELAHQMARVAASPPVRPSADTLIRAGYARRVECGRTLLAAACQVRTGAAVTAPAKSWRKES